MPPSTLNRLGRALDPHRRRIGLALIGVAALVVGGTLEDAFPREVHVRYLLGPAHAGITEVRLLYATDAEEAVQGARFDYPEGAPAEVEHHLRLPPGSYRVLASLSGGGRSREVRRTLQVPADGRVDLELFDLAFAGLGGEIGRGGARP